MKAVVRNTYGSPDVLELVDVEKPELTDDTVLVRVRATSVNPVEWYGVTGHPIVGRGLKLKFGGPKDNRLGVDFAGTVEAVGKEITHVRPGDDVFGGKSGAFAEYVRVRDAVVPKPANVTFEEAAGVGVAGLTALQGLRDKGQLQAGQKVLINGASGGVGTFAVQIAKALGAEVTGVCSTGKVELVRSLGADHVVDYTKEDFTRGGRRYDLIFDVAGSRRWSECKRVLEPDGTLVIVGAPKGGAFLGPLSHIIRMKLASIGSSRKAIFFVAKFNRPDMEVLRELIESGKVTPVVDRTYELTEIADALRYLGEGHARGKVIVRV